MTKEKKPESYETIRRRHDDELRDWVRGAMRRHTSITSAARGEGINPGTLYRIAKRLGVISEEKKS